MDLVDLFAWFVCSALADNDIWVINNVELSLIYCYMLIISGQNRRNWFFIHSEHPIEKFIVEYKQGNWLSIGLCAIMIF